MLRLRAPRAGASHAAASDAAPAAVAAPVTTVSGMVYDSLSDAPLDRRVGDPRRHGGIGASRTRPATIVIDADRVPDGRYQLSFFHPALDSIGVAPPPRTIVIKGRASVVADLAMPSAASILHAVCPDSLRSEGRGLLIGDVRDAETDRPLAGALVVVMWSAISIGNSSISRLPRAMNARTDSDGLFRICGVPSQTPLRTQARLTPKASGWLDLTIQPGGVVVQQFLIGETPTVAGAPPKAPAAGAAVSATAAAAAPVVGSSTLIGTVVGGDDAPLEGAQVLLIGSTMTVSARADATRQFPAERAAVRDADGGGAAAVVPAEALRRESRTAPSGAARRRCSTCGRRYSIR